MSERRYCALIGGVKAKLRLRPAESRAPLRSNVRLSVRPVGSVQLGPPGGPWSAGVADTERVMGSSPGRLGSHVNIPSRAPTHSLGYIRPQPPADIYICNIPTFAPCAYKTRYIYISFFLLLFFSLSAYCYIWKHTRDNIDRYIYI